MTILDAIRTCCDTDAWMARPSFRQWVRPNWTIHGFIDRDGNIVQPMDLHDIASDDWATSLTCDTPPYLLAEVPRPR